MAEVRIHIGGRDFEVTCQPGEEHFLKAAAKLLDNEATVLVSQIGRLPEALRLAFVLRDVEELPMNEVAEVLDIGVSAAKMRVARARETLRTELTGRI